MVFEWVENYLKDKAQMTVYITQFALLISLIVFAVILAFAKMQEVLLHCYQRQKERFLKDYLPKIRHWLVTFLIGVLVILAIITGVILAGIYIIGCVIAGVMFILQVIFHSLTR